MTHLHEEEEHKAPWFKNIAFLSFIKVSEQRRTKEY